MVKKVVLSASESENELDVSDNGEAPQALSKTEKAKAKHSQSKLSM